MDKKVISCEFNFDTACVEVKFADGNMIAMLWSRISFRLSVRQVVSTVILVGSACFYFSLRPIWARASLCLV